MYNGTIERIEKLEQQGCVIVLRKSEHIKISRIEKNPDKLQELYNVGVADAKGQITRIRDFLTVTKSK